MAVDLFFDPPLCDLPPLRSLRLAWLRVPDAAIREAIVAEHQYLHFHEHVLRNCRYTDAGQLSNPPWRYHLTNTVRAGAIKAKLLLSASIVEAALRAHAERRGYHFHNQPGKRTFRSVLGAWSTNRQADGPPRPDLTNVWTDLHELNNLRNNIHLFAAAGDPNAGHAEMVRREGAHAARAEALVAFCQTLESP